MRWYGYIGGGLIFSTLMILFTLASENLRMTWFDVACIIGFGSLGLVILLMALRPRDAGQSSARAYREYLAKLGHVLKVAYIKIDNNVQKTFLYMCSRPNELFHAS